jgi:hypothetical protein
MATLESRIRRAYWRSPPRAPFVGSLYARVVLRRDARDRVKLGVPRSDRAPPERDGADGAALDPLIVGDRAADHRQQAPDTASWIAPPSP